MMIVFVKWFGMGFVNSRTVEPVQDHRPVPCDKVVNSPHATIAYNTSDTLNYDVQFWLVLIRELGHLHQLFHILVGKLAQPSCLPQPWKTIYRLFCDGNPSSSVLRVFVTFVGLV